MMWKGLHCFFRNIKFEIRYFLAKQKMKKKKFDIHIMSIDETIDYISQRKASIVRFGDGEFSIMANKNICPFQEYSKELSERLAAVINKVDSENLLICLPETMSALEKFKPRTKKHWTITFSENFYTYQKNICVNYYYGNAFLSRPYMIYEDKSRCALLFDKILALFANQDIVVIEGEYSRNGVGNDLFSTAKSVKRIICPPDNAFNHYQKILDAAKTLPQESLILVSIGPASKPLVVDLVDSGYWVLDIGHIDSEYEWFKNNVPTKTAIAGKHSAEGDDGNIGPCKDKKYIDSIIAII